MAASDPKSSSEDNFARRLRPSFSALSAFASSFNFRAASAPTISRSCRAPMDALFRIPSDLELLLFFSLSLLFFFLDSFFFFLLADVATVLSSESPFFFNLDLELDLFFFTDLSSAVSVFFFSLDLELDRFFLSLSLDFSLCLLSRSFWSSPSDAAKLSSEDDSSESVSSSYNGFLLRGRSLDIFSRTIRRTVSSSTSSSSSPTPNGSAAGRIDREALE
mmetsp:Transcript_9488/g.19723  ORF Transcript_9488/g.19723 Transcript_9488/m.19723 type:complete len:219 (+) Transcript_9488:1411-2067(+)